MTARIAQYEIVEKLYESRRTLIYRGRRFTDGESVILKILKPDVATKDELARFRREFIITSKIDLPGVIKALRLEDYNDSLLMVFKDIGGNSLDRILDQASLSITQSLELMIALADIVGLIHKQRIIHKNINPSNIIFNPDTRQINLIDFDLADEAPEHSITPQPPATLEGTLEYISPEQTGRMNRPVDYRTDFYSLGVTFYQMLTGKQPFEADDALGMVYSQIAKTPVPPYELDPSIPEMVSFIVMKLLSKMADDRYQSAWGLKADLEKCLIQLISEGIIHQFELGEEDFSDQLRIPRRLYGRQKETDRLFDAFDLVAAGGRELLLVAGYAGVGKTALVHEIYRPILEKRGYFIEGKFEQLQRNIPYFAWIQAFEGLVNYLLMGSETELTQWKQNILKAVGSIGRVLTDVIPNLELIIGPQPAVPELGGIEAQNRFNYVFLEFVKAIVVKDRPLVIFLDDLQWIDAASLKLLQTLLTGSGISSVLVIGAYRDNEVDALHPLMKSIDALRKESASIEILTLRELSEKTVNMLIIDILYSDSAQTADLTHLIYSKTGGNPYFILQMLRTLAEKQAILFDRESRTWQWDISVIEKMKIADNIVNLMVGKIRQLPTVTQRLLPLAACMGFRFSLSNLSIIAKISEGATLEGLKPALREGLIVAGAEYQFVHDRVQQAAYTLIPTKKRPAQHLRIGRLLLANTPEGELTENIFDIVDHLNRGMDLIAEPDEREQLAELNLIAGRRAKAATAFILAVNLFAAGMNLLTPNSWETKYDLASALLLEQAETEYQVGNYEFSDELITKALDHVTATPDRAWAYRLRQRLYQLSGRFNEAMDVALEALRSFGVSFPDSDEDILEATENEIRQVSINLNGRRIADLADIPLSDNVEARALIGLLEEGMPLIYVVRPILWPLITAKGVNLCLQRGHADESPFVYSCYAMVLVGVVRDISSAIQFSKMAIALNERLPREVAWKGKLLFHHSALINIWGSHIRTNLPLLDEAFQASLVGGDIVNAGYLTYNAIWLHFENGDSLEEVIQLARRYATFNQQNHNDIVYNVDRMEEQFALSLRGETRSATDFSDTAFDEDDRLAEIERSGFSLGIAYHHIMKQITAFLAGRYGEALEWADRARPMLLQVASMVNEATYYFYYALTLAALYEEASEQQRREYEGILVDILEKLKFWADHCPENFANRYALVGAEIARIKQRDQEAAHLYEQAIVFARENGFIQNEAVAYEVAAGFYRQRGFDKFARTYLAEAAECYSRWGAAGKVRQLERLHQWLAPARQREAVTLTEHLDAVSLAKAQQAISSEIHMDYLGQTLLRITMENAGAQKGCLCLEGDGMLQALIRNDDDSAPRIIFDFLPYDVDVPLAIFNYVRHSRETVILPDARVDAKEFSADEYLLRVKPRSVLCMAIQRKDKLLAVLYLENNLLAGAFTSERRIILEMLASQAAISLETAAVYEALRDSEEKYRRIVDTANEGIWVIGPDTITTFVNARMSNMLGYKTEEMLGRSVTDFMFEEDVPDYLKKIANRRKGISENFERRYRRKNGQEVWTLASATPIFDDEHRSKGFFAMFTDITERKMAEDHKQEFYRLTILAATEGKLQLTAREEIERIAGSPTAVFQMASAEDFRNIRAAVVDIARSIGIDELRAGDYCVAVGEAVTNATKHANSGAVSIHILPESMLTVVSDKGQGIEAMSIPKVALEKGYTTTGTLGMGYKVILSIADKVYLATGLWGTTVGIEMYIKPLEVIPDINAIYRM